MMMGTGGCQGGGQGSVQCSTGGFSAVSSPLASNTVPYGCCVNQLGQCNAANPQLVQCNGGPSAGPSASQASTLPGRVPAGPSTMASAGPQGPAHQMGQSCRSAMSSVGGGTSGGCGAPAASSSCASASSTRAASNGGGQSGGNLSLLLSGPQLKGIPRKRVPGPGSRGGKDVPACMEGPALGPIKKTTHIYIARMIYRHQETNGIASQLIAR